MTEIWLDQFTSSTQYAVIRKRDCRLSRSTSDIPLDYYQPKMAVRVELKWNFAISLVDLVSGTAVQIT